ncbi:heterokaryon incompatibility protein-domain-containing protein, partial [Paraphoma chrysanthemicola]
MRLLPSTSTQGLLQWGKSDVLRSIEINGKIFNIRQNLYDLLEVLYAESTSRLKESTTYWIDALCIDQTNILERNHQVAQMGQIFSNAACVHVWLGKSPRALLPAIEAIRNDKGPPKSALSYKIVRTTISLISENIIHNPYFSRAWITQEILLACGITVRIGTEVVDLKYLIAALEYFRGRGMINYSDRPTKSSNAFRQLTLRWNNLVRPDPLVSLLARFRARECHDPRDRIYSLLSLSSKEGRQVQVDYNSNPSTLAANVMRECQSLLCICSTALVLQALDIDNPTWEARRPGEMDQPSLEFGMVLTEKSLADASTFAFKTNDGLIFPGTNDALKLSDGKLLRVFDVTDTCESPCFKTVIITLNSIEATSASLRWGKIKLEETATANANGEFYRQGEIRLTRDPQRQDVFVARMSFALLARVSSHPVSMCRKTKLRRNRWQENGIGAPRIFDAFESAGKSAAEYEMLPVLYQGGWEPDVMTDERISPSWLTVEKETE